MQAVNRTGQDGFTLLDLAVAMIVIGIFMATSIQAYREYVAYKDIGETNATLDGLQVAMENYYFEFGALPCPADITLSPADGGYGDAQDCTTMPDPIVSGGIPFKILKVPAELALDAWDQKMVYTVVRTLTDPATYNPSGGTITIQRFLEYGVPNVPFTTGQYVITSYGPTGAGATTVDGVLKTDTPCPAIGVRPMEGENCNGDGIFINPDGIRNLAEDNANFMDDQMAFITQVPSRLWVESPNGQDVMSQNVMVGIGTGSVLPQHDVDVAGNIYASSAGNLHTGRLCQGNDATATGACIEPDKIGGVGMNCADDAAGAMRGIAGGDKVCSTSRPFIGACNPGQLVYAIDAGGNVLCR